MANLLNWLRGRSQMVPVKCSEMELASTEFVLREWAFGVCINYIAAAMGRCEFRTFQGGKETQGHEYYLWNFEPNKNQNSTAFVHKLISQLYINNEALIIASKRPDGLESLSVADSFDTPENRPVKENQYTNVVVGDVAYNRTFKEHEVIHLTLADQRIDKIVSAMYGSFCKMVDAAVHEYTWNNSPHWKVRIERMASGNDEFTAQFTKMLEEQIKPFLTGNTGILPEFANYAYSNEAQKNTSGLPEEISKMIKEIFHFTCMGFQIPSVLLDGSVEATGDALQRFYSCPIDTLCDQLSEEITRKRYGFDGWKAGNYIRLDSSAINHFDLFANAAAVEKVIGSGAYSINDFLRSAGQPTLPYDWADKHYLTKNIADLEASAQVLGSAGKE